MKLLLSILISAVLLAQTWEASPKELRWLAATRTSTVLTFPAIAAGRLAVGNTVCGAIAAATFTLSGTPTGTAWEGLASDCTRVVRHNVTGTCSGCTAQSGQSGPDPNDGRLSEWVITSGAIAASPTYPTAIQLSRPFFAGANITFSTTAVGTTIASTGFDPLDPTVAYDRDEFTANNAAGSMLWTARNGATIISVANVAGHPGLAQIGTTATTTAMDLKRGSVDFMANPHAERNWDYRWKLLCPAADSVCQAGYYDVFDVTSPANFIYANSDNGNANWQFCRRAASDSRTCVDSGVPTSTTLYPELRIRSLVIGTVRLSISTVSGTWSTEKTICASGCDLSGTMPTTAMNPFFLLYNAGAAVLTVDRFAWGYTGL